MDDAVSLVPGALAANRSTSVALQAGEEAHSVRMRSGGADSWFDGVGTPIADGQGNTRFVCLMRLLVACPTLRTGTAITLLAWLLAPAKTDAPRGVIVNRAHFLSPVILDT